jgi:DNA transformation protein and related proteins
MHEGLEKRVLEQPEADEDHGLDDQDLDVSRFHWGVILIDRRAKARRLRRERPMAVSESFLSFVLEQLAAVRLVVTKRMFGGVGIYSDGTFFAVIDNDTLFFKVDETLGKRYRDRGMPPFMPVPGATPPKSTSGYYQVPPDVLEDADALARWAKDSIAIAAKPRRAKARRK